MTSAEARKLDILLALKKNGYNLVDGDKPEIMTMSLGGGYTLECNVKNPTAKWNILVDGSETKYPADSEEVVFTYRKDSDQLIKEYNAELRALFEDGVRVNDDPEPIPNLGKSVKQEVVKEIPACNEWKAGGYTKVIEAEYQVKNINTPKPGRTIKGLTPRLAECGKIKIGIKGEARQGKSGEYRLPKKLDYFIVTTMEKGDPKKGELDDFIVDTDIMEKLGNNCREIPVRLPYDDPTLNFPTSYAFYDSSACQCRGDGETAITSMGEVIECHPETCPNVKEKKCKPNGILSVILDDAPRVGGVYKFRTTGWNSINNLISSMELIRGLTNGFLAGLPLMLTLTPKHTTVPGSKTPTIIYMVNLEYRGSLAEMARAIKQTMDTRALMQYSVKDFEKLAEETISLPEAPEECKAIVEEFYPEAVA